MAKGLRASTEKANKSKLRSRVFSSIEADRKERLSAKLLNLAKQPRTSASDDVVMTTNETAIEKSSRTEATSSDRAYNEQQAMDIDKGKPLLSKSTAHGSGRIQKRGRGKARAAMVFPVYKKGKITGRKTSVKQRK